MNRKRENSEIPAYAQGRHDNYISKNEIPCIMTKLLIWKCYHALIYIYRSYKQIGTIKVLPPLVVPISSLAHGLIQLTVLPEIKFL